MVHIPPTRLKIIFLKSDLDFSDAKELNKSHSDFSEAKELNKSHSDFSEAKELNKSHSDFSESKELNKSHSDFSESKELNRSNWIPLLQTISCRLDVYTSTYVYWGWRNSAQNVPIWWVRDMEMLSACCTLCEGIHRSPVDSHHKGPVMHSFNVFFHVSLTTCWTNSGVASDVRHHSAHVMSL